MKILKKPFVFSVFYSVFLILLSLAILLDAFVIPNELQPSVNGGAASADVTFLFGENTGVPIEDTTSFEAEGSDAPIEDTSDITAVTDSVETEPDEPETIISDTEYKDENIKITLETVRIHDTEVYIADVYISSAEYFKTALAKNKFGTNIAEKTSKIASNNGAILAINGDYYGADKKGYVIKNGTLYRESIRNDCDYGDLCFMYDGSFKVYNEREISAKELLNSGVYQLFTFGPVLVNNSNIAVKEGDEVGVAMASNPRTAVGIVDKLHYVFVVSDGRTKESRGLSLVQLAEVMKDRGCTLAYNLDGGGSSTMYFNGRVVNKPVNRGSKISEREVSDIVYIGYR